MTEDEMKKTWCPHARVADLIILGTGNPGAINKWMEGGKIVHAKCLGSACSQWRWESAPDIAPEHIKNGYCGLAGRP